MLFFCSSHTESSLIPKHFKSVILNVLAHTHISRGWEEDWSSCGGLLSDLLCTSEGLNDYSGWQLLTLWDSEDNVMWSAVPFWAAHIHTCTFVKLSPDLQHLYAVSGQWRERWGQCPLTFLTRTPPPTGRCYNCQLNFGFWGNCSFKLIVCTKLKILMVYSFLF